MFENAFALLQKMGRSLMLPVSVLPAAGILLGVGSADFSWMPDAVSNLMAQAGGAVFGSLPLLFAIAVAIGLAQNDGVASLAAVVGFFVMIATLGVLAPLFGVEPKSIFGINSIDTGVFGGMLIGASVVYFFDRSQGRRRRSRLAHGMRSLADTVSGSVRSDARWWTRARRSRASGSKWWAT